MSDEGKNQMVPGVNPEGQGQASPTEPMDLSQAFKTINEEHNKAAESNVEGGTDGPAEGQTQIPPLDGAGGNLDDAGNAGGPTDGLENTTGDGGQEALGSEQVDKLIQELAVDIETRARNDVIRKYEEDSFRPWTIDDLYERDEQAGTVYYKNPENERQPFASRIEAEQWIQSMNNHLKSAMQADMNERITVLAEEEKPVIQMLQFLPTYNKMEENTKAIFMDIVRDYAVKDSNGKTKGYNTDLDVAYRQAQNIAGRFAITPTRDPVPPVSQAPTEPTMDLKSKGSSGTPKTPREPKDIGEAMRILQEEENEKEKK